MAKMQQSREDLDRHLHEQLGFLERSAAAFDSGQIDEAKRLAVSIRTLVHDTKQSRSLVSQLRIKNRPFCNSALPRAPESLVTYAGLVGISIGTNGIVKHVAPLDGDDPDRLRWIDFDAWWNAIITVDGQGRKLKRKTLVLAVSNQDGGAHVDPALDEEYARLSRHNSLQWSTIRAGRSIPLTDAAPVCVRQIAHEILKSLIPGYSKKPFSPNAAIISNVSVTFQPHDTSPQAE
jgi:hypothetical protein